jgi:acyl-CoA thioesterase-1
MPRTVPAMVGGVPPAPRWAWAVMAVSVVAIAVMSYLLVNRPPPPGFVAPESAQSSAEVPAGASAEVPGEELRVLVVGDGATAVPEGEVGWPQLVAEGIAAEGPPVEMRVVAADGSGYLQAPPGGSTFAELAESAGPDWDVVVFFGSRHDISVAADVQAAAQSTFEAARAASPDAELLAIGPAWPLIPAPGYIMTNRDAISGAAATEGVRFVDPLAQTWLAAPGLTGPDGESPSEAGRRALADRILPLVAELVPAGG